MPNQDAKTDAQPTPAKPPKQGQPHLKTDELEAKKKWDIIDEHAWESFPASDPPASWAGRDIAPQEREENAQAQSDGAPGSARERSDEAPPTKKTRSTHKS